MYPTKFSPHSSQRLVKLERWTAIALAKKRPHPLTRTTKEKRATSHEYIFLRRLIPGIDGRKPYTEKQNTGTLPRQLLRSRYELRVFLLHVQRPNDFV